MKDTRRMITVKLQNKKSENIAELQMPEAVLEGEKLPSVILWRDKVFMHFPSSSIKPIYHEVPFWRADDEKIVT